MSNYTQHIRAEDVVVVKPDRVNHSWPYLHDDSILLACTNAACISRLWPTYAVVAGAIYDRGYQQPHPKGLCISTYFGFREYRKSDKTELNKDELHNTIVLTKE